MRSKKGCNDDNLKFSKQSWPLQSIFEPRDPTTPTLNSTLSLTCDNQDVEMLKECLFKDPFDLCQEFIRLRINSRANFYQPSADYYFCCECDYIECHHFDNEAMSPESGCYLALTCPVCVFRVGKTCNRCYSSGCCLENMIRCGLLWLVCYLRMFIKLQNMF